MYFAALLQEQVLEDGFLPQEAGHDGIIFNSSTGNARKLDGLRFDELGLDYAACAEIYKLRSGEDIAGKWIDVGDLISTTVKFLRTDDNKDKEEYRHLQSIVDRLIRIDRFLVILF